MEKEMVAPLVGAWIETTLHYAFDTLSLSLPSWERGLKLQWRSGPAEPQQVAPLVGAWIETKGVVTET